MKRTFAFLTCALATLAIAASPTGLERTAKAGDKAEYTLLLDFKYPNGSGTFKASISEETKAASGTGFEVVRSYKDAVVIVDTNEYKQNMAPYTVSFDKAGKVLVVSGDEIGPDSMRFTRLWAFVAPGKQVDTGDSWKVTEAENKDADRPGFEMDCTFVGKEAMAGCDCAKVTFKAKEQGDSKAAAEGTFWIRLTDGATVKTEADLHNAPNAGLAIDGKVSYALKP